MDTHNCGCGECGHEHDDNCSHEHDDNCGCGGCGSQTVVISLDGDEDLTCNVIGVFGVAETDYIALQPVGGDEVLIFRYAEQDGGVSLDNIQSDEEYEQVSEAFYALFEEDDDFDDEDFDEDFDDEDFDDDFDDGTIV